MDAKVSQACPVSDMGRALQMKCLCFLDKNHPIKKNICMIVMTYVLYYKVTIFMMSISSQHLDLGFFHFLVIMGGNTLPKSYTQVIKKRKLKMEPLNFSILTQGTYLDLKSALKLIELFGIRSLPFKYSNSLQFMRHVAFI